MAPAHHFSSDLRAELLGQFCWRTDRAEPYALADVSGWWRSPTVLSGLGGALAGLVDGSPTVVLGPTSRGPLVGALVAQHLVVGLVEARKEIAQASDSDRWVSRVSRPDYRDRHVQFGFRSDLIRAGDRVLMVDDWIDTGATALTLQALVADVGAHWLGAAVIVDALDDSRLRRQLMLRSLLHVRELGG